GLLRPVRRTDLDLHRAADLVDRARESGQMTTITGNDDISIMPGGGIARRPLHVIILADCSGSMAGENMQALNFAIASMLPHLADWELEQERADVLIRTLSFATTPTWHIEEPTPVGKVRWKPLAVVPKGRTNLGPAL